MFILNGVFSNIWENFPSNGIYFKNIGELRQQSGKISIVNNINLRDVADQMDVITNFVANVNDNCFIEIPECVDFIRKAKIQIKSLRKDFDTIYHLLGVDTSHKRYKRGLLNIVGSGLKVLFGTLDSEDAKQYEDAIIITKENSEYIHKSQQEEIKVLDGLNKQNIVLKNAYYELGNLTNTLTKTLEDISNKINKDRKYFALKEYFTEFKLRIYFLISQTEMTINQITEAILFLQDNVIHPIIIEPKHFIQLLKESDKENVMLFTPSLESYSHIMKEINTTAYLKKDRFVIILSVPLLENSKSEVYEMINLPYGKSKGNFYILEQKHKYFIIKENKEEYIISNNILKDCKKIEKYFVCNQLEFKNSVLDKDCELTIFMNRINSNCNLKQISNHVEIFHKIAENKYLFALSEETKYKCNCSKSIYDEEGIINHIGIINLKNDCTFETIETRFKTANQEITIENKDVYRPVPEDCCINVKLKELDYENINLPKLKLKNLNELQDFTIEIKNQESFISKKLKDIPPHTQGVLFGLSGIIIIGIIVCCLLRFIKGNGITIFRNCFNKKTKQPVVQREKIVHYYDNHKSKTVLRRPNSNVFKVNDFEIEEN